MQMERLLYLYGISPFLHLCSWYVPSEFVEFDTTNLYEED